MDLTIFSLLSVAGYWIYGPLWGSFSCYAHKCTWTMLLAYLLLISCHWTKDLGGTQGTDWYSRLPHHCFHVPGPSCEFSCWHFGGCLTSGSCPWGLPSMPAAMLWAQGKPPGTWELDAKSRKSRDKKTSRISCSESSPVEEPPHTLWSRCLWQRELQGRWDEETKNMSVSGFSQLCPAGSSHSDKVPPAQVGSYRFAPPLL